MNNWMHNISPGLFLGNMRASQNLALLKENNITHILVVGFDLEKHYPQDFTYHQIEVYDVEHEDIISHFSAAVQFIEEALKTGCVLVHCAAGISRSSTIVIAYLMQKHRWNKKTAYEFTYERRRTILPNSSFQNQLELYHSLEYKVDSEHPDIKKLKETLRTKEIVYNQQLYQRYGKFGLTFQ